MPVQTLDLILQEHKRTPAQRLYLYGMDRSRIKNRLAIYDMDMPWRSKSQSEDTTYGWSEGDWWMHSHVCNVPQDYMIAYDELVKVKDEVGNVKVTEDIERPGYKRVLTSLLNFGCIVPSKVLDEWLQDSSLKFCDPWLRMRYKVN